MDLLQSAFLRIQQDSEDYPDGYDQCFDPMDPEDSTPAIYSAAELQNYSSLKLRSVFSLRPIIVTDTPINNSWEWNDDTLCKFVSMFNKFDAQGEFNDYMFLF